MGNWNITIRGHGCHHNRKADVKDANLAAAEFVKRLQADGHSIVAASFTHGAEDDLGSPDGYLKAWGPKETDAPATEAAEKAPPTP